MTASIAPGALVPRSAELPDPAQAGRSDSSGQAEAAVAALGRNSPAGIAGHLAGLVVVELGMPGADGLPRRFVVTLLLCFMMVRFAGFYLASRRHGSLRQRLGLLAIGAIGANAVWGVRIAALQLHSGAGEDTIVMAFVMCGLATGGAITFAPNRWIQATSLAVLMLPAVILGVAGLDLASLTVLRAMFFVYIMAQSGVAHRDYQRSVRAAEALRRHAEAAQQAAIAADATNLQLRAEIAHSAKMEVELRQAQKLEAIGRLAAGIAHEINNPLAYVIGNLEAAAETLQVAAASPAAGVLAAHAEVTAVIGDARDGAERVRKIVHGLRLFSRSEQENRVPLALTEVIEAAVRLTGNVVRHRAQLVRELEPAPLVVADDSRLTQVLINLLVNAAQAIPEGRSDQNRITVRTRTDHQGWAVIEVEDSGKGIASEVRARVFDPFFTTKSAGEGTGLGLSICHGIIQGLGGQISLESNTDRDHPVARIRGTGTIVCVVLPPAVQVPAPPPAVVTAASQVTASPRRHRVLVVDDEPLVALTMERLLRRDHDVTVAVCGRDALAHITRGARFDAIVSDVMMPNMTGIEVFEEIQRIAPDQARRMIFLSGGAFTAQTRERLDQRGVPQLEKPVAAKDLRAAVLRVVTEGLPPP